MTFKFYHSIVCSTVINCDQLWLHLTRSFSIHQSVLAASVCLLVQIVRYMCSCVKSYRLLADAKFTVAPRCDDSWPAIVSAVHMKYLDDIVRVCVELSILVFFNVRKIITHWLLHSQNFCPQWGVLPIMVFSSKFDYLQMVKNIKIY